MGRIQGFGLDGGGGGGLVGSSTGVYRPPRPSYSAQVGAYNRGFGDPTTLGAGDSSQSKRPYQLVGKHNINLLDPTAGDRLQTQYLSAAGIEPVHHEGTFGGVQDYYDPTTPGGIATGLVGALGQTIGGVFGAEGAKTGAEIGGAIGKTLEIPMTTIGSIGAPSMFAPFIDQANAAIEKDTPYL